MASRLLVDACQAMLGVQRHSKLRRARAPLSEVNAAAPGNAAPAVKDLGVRPAARGGGGRGLLRHLPEDDGAVSHGHRHAARVARRQDLARRGDAEGAGLLQDGLHGPGLHLRQAGILLRSLDGALDRRRRRRPPAQLRQRASSDLKQRLPICAVGNPGGAGLAGDLPQWSVAGGTGGGIELEGRAEDLAEGCAEGRLREAAPGVCGGAAGVRGVPARGGSVVAARAIDRSDGGAIVAGAEVHLVADGLVEEALVAETAAAPEVQDHAVAGGRRIALADGWTAGSCTASRLGVADGDGKTAGVRAHVLGLAHRGVEDRMEGQLQRRLRQRALRLRLLMRGAVGLRQHHTGRLDDGLLQARGLQRQEGEGQDNRRRHGHNAQHTRPDCRRCCHQDPQRQESGWICLNETGGPSLPIQVS
mmetsp:Transcript_77818/g.241103  ORF Transcript_77818/g.241103 Transcript_77818/m.241103 type:complete len:418 (+) Transcript_77818:1092-2345(+)